MIKYHVRVWGSFGYMEGDNPKTVMAERLNVEDNDISLAVRDALEDLPNNWEVRITKATIRK